MPHKGGPLIALVRTAPPRRVLLTLASIVVSIFLGFLAFSPAQAQKVVNDYGYYLITSTFVWLIISLVRVTRRGRPRSWVRVLPCFYHIG